jgi:phosphate transport system substrate-binding protein
MGPVHCVKNGGEITSLGYKETPEWAGPVAIIKIKKMIGEKTMKKLTAISVMAMMLTASASAFAVEVDPAIPAYQQTSGVSGNLNSIGSDTLNNLNTYWAEGFKAIYPNVNIQIEGKGSSTAPPALTEGTSQLGPMSRPMKTGELAAFEAKYGYKPTRIRVAIDNVAVYVNKDNPVENLNLDEVDGIFSSTFKRKGDDIRKWGAVLGMKPGWTNKPISIYGRNSASGTYAFFKKKALKKGDYKDTVKEQPGSSAVVQAVASDLGGIGYSGIGYKTSGVKAISIDGAAPTMDNAISGKYPLSRFLNIYVNKKPGEPLDKLTLEFIKFVLSQKGQEIVIKDGYYPINDAVVQEELAKLS